MTFDENASNSTKMKTIATMRNMKLIFISERFDSKIVLISWTIYQNDLFYQRESENFWPICVAAICLQQK